MYERLREEAASVCVRRRERRNSYGITSSLFGATGAASNRHLFPSFTLHPSLSLSDWYFSRLCSRSERVRVYEHECV